MSHATTKLLSALAIAGAVLTTGCGSSTTDNKAADDMLARARTAVSSGNYEQAIALLDSIDRTYPEALDVRKESMKVRPKAIERLTLEAIAETDSLIARSEREMARLISSMSLHENNEIGESYYVPRLIDNSGFTNKTGVSVRVDSRTGALYVVSSVNPGRIAQRYVTFDNSAGNVVSTDTISADSQANYVTKNSELLEFLPRYCTRLSSYLAENDGKPLAITIVGDKGSRTVKAGAAQSKAMSDAARLSQALTGARNGVLERERLERSLQVAREQQNKL